MSSKPLNEVAITRAIIDGYMKKLESVIELDVAIAGAGPAGLVAAYYLKHAGFHVAVFEKRLSPGGGIWGGGIGFNELVVQPAAGSILDDFGIPYRNEGEYLVMDSVLLASGLVYGCTKIGVPIMNLLSVEDVMIKEQRVTGLVLNWTAIEMAGLHVDPVTIQAENTIDTTGHECSVIHKLQNKQDVQLATETGKIIGEHSMWAEQGEKFVVEYAKEVFPGIYVAGMSVNAVFGGPRMGPIFGGMLLSGKRVAELIVEKRR